MLQQRDDASGDEPHHPQLRGQLAEDGVDVDERSVAEERKNGRVRGRGSGDLGCGSGACGWRGAGGVLVPEGVGEALEDFDAVGELQIFGVDGIWEGAAGADIFEEDREVAQAPEEVLGEVG